MACGPLISKGEGSGAATCMSGDVVCMNWKLYLGEK